MQSTKAPSSWSLRKQTTLQTLSPEQRREMTEEALDFLEYTEEKLLQLESSPQNQELVLRILRSFERVFTLARTLNLRPTLELLQKLQNFLYHVHQGDRQLNREDVSWLYESVELLGELIARSATQPANPSGNQVPGTLQHWYERILGWTKEQMNDMERYNPFRSRNFAPRLGELLSAKGLNESILAQVILPPPQMDARESSQPTEASSSASFQSPPPAQYKKRSVYFGHTVHEEHSVTEEELDDLLNVAGDFDATLRGLQSYLALHPERASELSSWTTRLHLLFRELKPRLRSVSMTTVDTLFQRMQRMMQEFRRRFQKEVELEFQGHECVIAKAHQQIVSDILLPLMRNTVEHGVESPAERVRLGKKPHGTVKIIAHLRDGKLEFCIKDDGRGLNRLWLQTEAIRQGLLKFQQPLDNEGISHLLFEKQVAVHARNQLQGYGLAQVARRVKDLKGSIHYRESSEGGCEFQVRLPLPPSFQQGVIGRVRREWFFLPAGSIEAIVPLEQVQFEYDSEQRSKLVFGKNRTSCFVATDSLPLEEHHRLPTKHTSVEREENVSIERFFVVLKGRNQRLCALEMNELQPDAMLEQTFLGSSYRKSPLFNGGGIQQGKIIWMLDTEAFFNTLQE
jgi:chemotaxis protein histidine kinase CheA